MKKTIDLQNGILIDGKTIQSVSYDTNEITPALFAEADARKKIDAGMKNVSIAPAAEFDFGLHMYLGFAAAIAVNPGYAFEDLARVHGADIIAFMEIGRNFLMKSEDSQQNNSGEQSETTADTTTQVSQTSKEND